MIMPEVLEDVALLVTRSRDLAIGLAALLLSVPPIRNVERTAGAELLRQRLRQARPALIIVDAGAVGSHMPEVLKSIRELSPLTRYLVLGDTVSDVREVQRLVTNGAGAAIVKGADPKQLAGAIERLLTGASVTRPPAAGNESRSQPERGAVHRRAPADD